MSHLAVLLLALWSLTISLAEAGFNPATSDNVAIYWGQNSHMKPNGHELAQKRLSYYCQNKDTTVIPLAFLNVIVNPMTVNFANTGENCTEFNGTTLLQCPEIEEDIKACQALGKTILLSIGGATYTEGGFPTEAEAAAAAEKVWATFGPPPVALDKRQQPETDEEGLACKAGNDDNKNALNAETTSAVDPAATTADPAATSTVDPAVTSTPAPATPAGGINRPFGSASVDGFDLDFETTMNNIHAFARRLRELMDSASAAAQPPRNFYLSAAPQCLFPDHALNPAISGPDPVRFDFVMVQFYNNWCGVQNFRHVSSPNGQPQGGGGQQNPFNMNEWDAWARGNSSGGGTTKVLLGVPGSATAASSGYTPGQSLAEIIAYCRQFPSFGGVMVWDMSQTYANAGFLESVVGALKGAAPAPAVSDTSTSSATDQQTTLTPTAEAPYPSDFPTTLKTPVVTTPTAGSYSMEPPPVPMPTAAPAPSASAAPPAAGAQVPQWGQCGGVGYHGPTQCVPPSTCVYSSEWWSSCQ